MRMPALYMGGVRESKNLTAEPMFNITPIFESTEVTEAA